MATYHNNKYTITTSLSDQYIIINITNNVSYACYEGKFENAAFRLSFDNTAIFKLVNKCFAEFVEPTGKSTYKVNIALSENTGAEHLVLDFDCVVEGFLAVAFKLRMVEKTVIAGDKGLIIELNQQKQLVSDLTKIIDKQQQTIDELVERMARIERALNRTTNDCPEIEMIDGHQNNQLSDSSYKATDIRSEILNEWSEDWFTGVLVIQSRLHMEGVDFDDDDWESISSNPNLTWKIVQQNPDNPWDWYGISENPNITWDIVQQNPDKPWDWDALSMNPNITYEIVNQNPDKPWNLKWMFIETPLTKSRETYIQTKMKTTISII